MRRRSTPRPLSTATFTAALLAFGCGSTTSKSTGEGATTVDGGGHCGADWVKECASQHCDPESAPWQDCKINGWAGYVAPPHCSATSKMAGDDVALCAPDPSDGIQLHYGPSDYDDPAQIEQFTLAVGGETTECSFKRTPNLTGKYFGQYLGSSRPGTHHLQISYAAQADQNEPDGTTGPCGSILETQFIAIAQTQQFQVPDLTIPRPATATSTDGGLDFEGSAAPMDPARVLELTAHYINTGSDPLLKEAWVNFYYRDPSLVKAALHPIMLLSNGIDIPPHSKGTFRRSCQTGTDVDVKYLQGHSHVGTDRFSIWHASGAGGDGGAAVEQKVYESYDALEPALIDYSPLVTNRSPNPTNHVAGGSSGSLLLKAGDSLVWECAFDNESNQTVIDGDPGQGNQMCYTFGALALPVAQAATPWVCLAAAPTTL